MCELGLSTRLVIKGDLLLYISKYVALYEVNDFLFSVLCGFSCSLAALSDRWRFVSSFGSVST